MCPGFGMKVFKPAVFDFGRVCCLKGFKEVLNIFIDLFVIRFDAKAVICVVVKELLTELALGQKRICGDDASCDVKGFQELHRNRDFMGLLTHGTFCDGDAYLMKDSCEQMRPAILLGMTVC